MSIVNGKTPDSPATRAHTSRIVIKFAPELHLSYSEAAEAEHADVYGQAWDALRSRFPGVTLRPFFATLDAATLENLEQRAAAAGAAPQLTSYFAIPVPHGADPAAIGQAVAAWPHVEFAYVEGGPVPPPNDPWWLTEIEGHLMLPPVNPDDDPLSSKQGYLSAAPEGIDARSAWTQADGSGIGFVDLEQGWTLDHEDLPASIPIIGTGSFLQAPEWIAHGTAVLGIVAAVDNDKGVIGIAPQAAVRVVSQWFETPQGTFFSTATAIASALVHMKAGDVLLVETTAPMVSKFGWVPAEVDPLVFALFSTATSIGITVVAPAGNNLEKPDTKDIGGSNLDAFTDTNGKFVLNRASPDFKDSGAIMVGAASANVPHQRLDFSNFGSRIDCFAWGENIATCGGFPFSSIGTSPQTAYMLNFAGTSGASAIVAGAAVLLQSWAARRFGSFLSTSRLRVLLSDKNLNTHSKTPINDLIGVMPDLRRIIQHLSRIPDRWDAIIGILIGGVIYGGGGWFWIPGSPPKPVPPRGERLKLAEMPTDKRDLVVGLALLELTAAVNDPAQRKTIQRSTVGLMRSAVEKIAAGVEER